MAINFPDPSESPWYNDPSTGGNGVTYEYTAQGYWTAVSVAGNNAIDIGTGDGRYVNLSGDTMTGDLGIGAEPFTALHAYKNIGGANPATSGTTDSNVFTRLQGGSVAFDLGGISSGLQWIQPRDVNDFSNNFGLSLCPNGGNVGVGTTGPLSLLSAHSKDSLGTTAGNSVSLLDLYAPTVNGDFLKFELKRDADGSDWTSASHTIYRQVDTTAKNYIRFGNDELGFGIGNAEHVTIGSSGDVGIATTTPRTVLEVKKGSNATENYPVNFEEYAASILNCVDGNDQNGLLVANRWQGPESTVLEVGSLYGNISDYRSFLSVNGIGYVGIGTNNPGAKLEVGAGNPSDPNSIAVFNTQDSVKYGILVSNWTGVTATLGPKIRFDNSGYGEWYLGGGDGTNTFVIGHSNDKVVIDSAGNVGIGTDNPVVPFVISDADRNIEMGYSGAGGNHYIQSYNRSSSAYTPIALAGEEVIIGSKGVNADESARFDSSGRLLVGTSTYVQSTIANQVLVETASDYTSLKLASNSTTADVSPFVVFSRSRGTSRGAATIVAQSDSLGGLLFAGADGGNLNSNAASIRAFVDGTPGANNMPGRLVFSTTLQGAPYPTERMRISSDGFTNIYTDTSVGVRTARTSSGQTAFMVLNGASSVSTGTIQFQVLANGSVENTGNSYGAISDEKLKKNIVSASDQWDDIKNIKVVNYNFKEETGHETHKQLGVIAQQVEKVSPGLVRTNDEGLKSVNYSVLYMKAVKALQESMTRIEALEQRLTDAGL